MIPPSPAAWHVWLDFTLLTLYIVLLAHALPMPAPSCPDPRFRAVIMTNEWQEQPQKLEAMRPSTCVGLNRSSDGTDAVYTLVPTPSPSSAPQYFLSLPPPP